MNKLDNIVVGVDFSERAKGALSEAARLAKANQSKLHVVHVVDEEAAEDLAEYEERELGDVRKDLIAQAEKTIRRWCEREEMPPESTSQVVWGHPVEELIKKIEQVDADLFVAGVRGTVNDAEGTGAQATRLVRKAPCEVLLVEDGQAQPFESAVACVDFSPTSKLVVEQALRVAELDGCELHFLHIYTAPWNKFRYLAEGGYGEDFRKSYLDDLEKKLRAFVGDTGSAKVTFNLHHYDHRGHGIGRVAAKKDADLVIIGTRGRTSLKYFLMGSTAEYVLSDRPCSVLAVRPPEE